MNQFVMQTRSDGVLLRLAAWSPHPSLIECYCSLWSQFLVDVRGRKQVLIWQSQMIPVLLA